MKLESSVGVCSPRLGVATRFLPPSFVGSKSPVSPRKPLTMRRIERSTAARPYWLLSVLFHLFIIAAAGLLVCKPSVVTLPVSDSIATVTDFHPLQAEFFEAPLELQDCRDQTLDVLQCQLVKEPNWSAVPDKALDSPCDEIAAEHPAQLEEASSDGGSGDGLAAAGQQHDFNAGSLDDLGGFTAGEELWNKIRPKTIGFGAPGSASGQGQGIAASGQGGGGQGVHGIAGGGMGYGSAGGLGSGSSGETKGGAVGLSRAVVAEKLGGGDYPKRALSQKREGVVGVRAEVLETGHVGRVELQRTSGFADLDNTALAAAKDWRFKPALFNGMPTSVWVSVNVQYRIGDQ